VEITVGQHLCVEVPRVQYEVEKASGFKIFLDIDMTNFFH